MRFSPRPYPPPEGFRPRAHVAAFLLAAVLAAALATIALLTLGAAAQAAFPATQTTVRLPKESQLAVNELAAQAEQVRAEIEALDNELEYYTEDYNKLQLQLNEINTRLISLRQDLEEAESDHAYRMERWEEQLCALYKAGGRNRSAFILLGADDLADFTYRVRLAAELASEDRQALEKLRESTARLDAIIQSIDESKQEQLAVRGKVNSHRQKILNALHQREEVLANISTQIRGIIQQEQERQAEQDAKLRRALDAILKGTQVFDGSLPKNEADILAQFLETAASYLGIPYVWAGDRPSTGFDCSGFTAYVYAQHGVRLPHYSGYQAQMGTLVEPEDIRPGDLLAFGSPVHHVGIYVGAGLFIHAPRTGDVVRVASLTERSDLVAIRRFHIQARTGPPAFW